MTDSQPLSLDPNDWVKPKMGRAPVVYVSDSERKCTKCGQVLPLDQFQNNKNLRGGKSYHCKKCISTERKKWKTGDHKGCYDRWYKAKGSLSGKERRRLLRAECIERYGNRCACCGETRKEFLAIDHINGGGKRHRKALNLGGSDFYRWLKRNHFPKGFRVLCHNCNLALGFYGYCPHQSQEVA